MTKKHFNDLAQACREIEQGLRPFAKVIGQLSVDTIMELVVARIAWVCTQHNPRFNSFKFNAAARGRKT